MAFIPKDVRWFVGELVESIQIAGQATALVHLNCVLIEARSADEAFNRALELGNQLNAQYLNTEGAKVVCKFEGLRELNVVHDELEHGAELFFRTMPGVKKDELSDVVTPKESLAVFRDTKVPRENYFPASIARELKERIGKSKAKRKVTGSQGGR